MAARGYLGKISAVVAINTGGVKPSLNATAKDIQSWGRTVQSRLSGTSDAAKRAFDGIFTPLQKLQAAVKAANRQPLDLKVPNVRSFLDLARATEQIAKPLGNAQKQLTGLSQGVQSELLPALVSAQKQASGLFDAIANGARITERDFANTEARINRVVQAIGRANEASQATRGLASGQELRFQNPEFLRSTSRAAQAQQQAAQLSPEAISSRGIVSLVGQQKLAADEAERLRAIIERTIATRNGDQEAARRAYTQQVAYLDQVTDRLERQIQLERQANQERAAAANRSFTLSRGPQEQRGLGLFGSGAGTEAERAIALARQVSARFAQLPESAQQGLRGLAGIASNVANGVEAGTSNANDLLAVLRRLQSAMADVNDGNIGASTNISYLTSLGGRAVGPRTDISQMGRSSPFFPGNGRGNPTGDFGPTLPPGFGGSSDAGLGRGIDDPQRRLDSLRGSVAAVKSQIEQLPQALQGGLIPALQASEVEFRRLAASPSATSAEIDRSTRKVAALTQEAGRAAKAAALVSFKELNETAGIGKLTAELTAFGSILTAIEAKSGGPVVAAYEKWRAAAQKAISTNTTGSAVVQRELDRLKQKALEAAAATGKISLTRASQAVARAGDIGRAGLDKWSLAVQQAGFAVDDFFSVTGSIDQRIRAISNNISQLAFIVGGTKGLFIGLAITIGAQLVAALAKYVFGGKEAEDQQKRLKIQTDALNASLERQRSLIEEIAQAYRELAKSVAETGRSESGRQAAGRRQQFRDLEDTQQRRRAEVAQRTDFRLIRDQTRATEARSRLEEESDPIVRRKLLRDLELYERSIRERLRSIEQSASEEVSRVRANERRFGIPAERQLRERRDSLEEEARTTSRLIKTLGGEAQAPKQVEQLQQITAALAIVEVALQRLADERTRAGFERGFSASDQLGRAQRNVSDVRGFTFVEQFGNQFSDKLQKLLEDLSQADSGPLRDTILKQIESLTGQSRAVENASVAVQEFSRSLEQAAGDLSRAVESELAGRAESLRRQANAVEAEFGADDQRTRQARADAQQIEEARRTATLQRQSIERQVSARRLEFEKETLEGRGDPAATQIADRIRQLEELQANASAPASQREAARLEIDRLREELNRLFESLPEIQDLRRRADQGDVDAQREIQDIESRARGRELAKTPQQRLREEAERNIRDINAEFDRQFRDARQAGRPLDELQDIRSRQREAINRQAEELSRQAAPAIMGFREERLNAALQGPSRAALNVADAQTMEGQRELNRLLRGDDPAKDVNLVELQKQSELLQGVIDAINEQAGADVVEIRG